MSAPLLLAVGFAYGFLAAVIVLSGLMAFARRKT